MRDSEGLSWWLFVVCAVFFTAGSIRSGDPFFVIGSLFFLAACVLFLAGRDQSGRDRPGAR